MMNHNAQKKWEWTLSAQVQEAKADQIWPLLKDFFNLHKWFPGLPICYKVHGNNGEVGSIRYNAGFNIPSVDGTISYAIEKLIAVDPEERMIRYVIVDCNTGFKSYVATLKICPGRDGGCVIWWFVTMDPIEGLNLEELVGKYEAGLNVMAKNMEHDALGIMSGSSV